MNRIIYKNQDDSVAVLIPAQEVLDTVGLLAIAEKDVPAPYKYPISWQTVTKTREEDIYDENDEFVETVTIEYTEEEPTEWAEYNTLYWLVNDTDIPSDRTDRDRWVLENMPDPDGFGGESNEFTDEQLLALHNDGVI